MTLPVTTADLISTGDHNEIYIIVDEILGLGENGYGLAIYNSLPISISDKIKAYDINGLIADVDLVKQHIDNTSVSTLPVNTGTTLVSTSTFNELKTTIDYYLDDSRRYTCHPAQFRISNPLTNSVLFYNEGSTSTRDTQWGETSSTSIRVISHRLAASWPTRLQARYYFNQGSYLSWSPYHLGGGLNDLDTEWAEFINWLQAPENQYIYNREQYLNWTGALGTSTVYSSGTLQITVQGIRSEDERSVEFNIEFTNLDTADLIVTPSVGYFNILV